MRERGDEQGGYLEFVISVSLFSVLLYGLLILHPYAVECSRDVKGLACVHFNHRHRCVHGSCAEFGLQYGQLLTKRHKDRQNQADAQLQILERDRNQKMMLLRILSYLLLCLGDEFQFAFQTGVFGIQIDSDI